MGRHDSDLATSKHLAAPVSGPLFHLIQVARSAMAISKSHPKPRISNLVLGGAGFSYQNHKSPEDLPVLNIIKNAFARGVQTIDTSPYYEPSEQLLGAALTHPDIAHQYNRSDYMLMTKIGRISSSVFDYSPQWIRKSVQRSLERLGTSYLDVVFCHDVEFVGLEDALKAIEVLSQLKESGIIRFVGISGYKLEMLIEIAAAALQIHGRPIDVVQTWAQLTLQNTNLETVAMDKFRCLGVGAVCSSSPLAVGLLRSSSVPVGSLGDWHPASPALRSAAREASIYVSSRGDCLAALSLRYAMREAQRISTDSLPVSVITGVSSLYELEENLYNAEKVLGKKLVGCGLSNHERIPDESSADSATYYEVDKDTLLVDGVRKILAPWLNRDFDGGP